eukprot:Awhi_evm1s12461
MKTAIELEQIRQGHAQMRNTDLDAGHASKQDQTNQVATIPAGGSQVNVVDPSQAYPPPQASPAQASQPAQASPPPQGYPSAAQGYPSAAQDYPSAPQ